VVDVGDDGDIAQVLDHGHSRRAGPEDSPQ